MWQQKMWLWLIVLCMNCSIFCASQEPQRMHASTPSSRKTPGERQYEILTQAAQAVIDAKPITSPICEKHQTTPAPANRLREVVISAMKESYNKDSILDY